MDKIVHTEYINNNVIMYIIWCKPDGSLYVTVQTMLEMYEVQRMLDQMKKIIQTYKK